MFQVINNDEDVIMLGERRGEGDTETDTQMYATSDVSDTDDEKYAHVPLSYPYHYQTYQNLFVYI